MYANTHVCNLLYLQMHTEFHTYLTIFCRFSMIICIYIYMCISDQLKNKIYYHDICYYPLCGLPLQLLAAYHLRLCPLSLTLSTGNSRFSRFSRFSRLSRPVGRFFTAVKTGICLNNRYVIYLFIYLLIYILYIHKENIYIILKAST